MLPLSVERARLGGRAVCIPILATPAKKERLREVYPFRPAIHRFRPLRREVGRPQDPRGGSTASHKGWRVSSPWRSIRIFCAVAFLVSAGAVSAAAGSVYAPENLGVTQRLRHTAVTSSQPAINMTDYTSLYSGENPGVDGHLIATTLAGKKNASGVEVYLIPDSPYTEWWAKLATINARGYTARIAPPLDKGLVGFYFKKTETDLDGDFHFYQVAPGTWLLFAAYELHHGRLVPGDSMQTAYDGNGITKSNVLAPNAKYDSSLVYEQFGYLYACTFANATAAGWDIGDVPNSEWIVNGAFR
jgi:hypothetical protein